MRYQNFFFLKDVRISAVFLDEIFLQYPLTAILQLTISFYGKIEPMLSQKFKKIYLSSYKFILPCLKNFKLQFKSEPYKKNLIFKRRKDYRSLNRNDDQHHCQIAQVFFSTLQQQHLFVSNSKKQSLTKKENTWTTKSIVNAH